MKFLHGRTAPGLVKEQSLLRRKILLQSDRVVAVGYGKRLQHMPAFLGKLFHHIHELPPAVGQAIAKNRLQFTRQIPRQRIAHLDGRGQIRGTLGQHVLQVLSGMLASAEEQRDLVTVVR